MYVCIHTHLCVYTHINICMYVYTQTHLFQCCQKKRDADTNLKETRH